MMKWKISSWSFCLLLVGLMELASAAAPPLFQNGNRSLGWRGNQKGVAESTYLDQVQPVFNARCVTCHGCYEAPCQLNLQSFDGLTRGYNPIPIFSSKRTGYTAPTRDFDAQTIEGWRALQFHPVAPHRLEPSPADRPDRYKESLLYRFLEASQTHNTDNFDLTDVRKLQSEFLDKDQRACVATKAQLAEHFQEPPKYVSVVSFEAFIGKNPHAGMPFALPRLDAPRAEAIQRWLEASAAGAQDPSPAALQALSVSSNERTLQTWEAFFNQGENPQVQQTARYIYEHVYSAFLHFDSNPGEYFELVRARNRTGSIDRIVTELPSQSPGVFPFYYRLQKVTRAIVQKNMNVWRLNDQKLARLRALFTDKPWSQKVPAPDYSPNVHPLVYFSPIPASARSRFMQENSKVIVGGMVQGMVCIGSTATYAIADHFWAFFLNPEVDPSVQSPTLGLENLSDLNTTPEPWKPVTLAGKKFAALMQSSLTQRLERSGLVAAKAFITEFRRVMEWAGFDFESEDGTDMLAEWVMQLHQHKLAAEEIVAAVHHFVRTTQANQRYQEAFEKRLRILLNDRYGRNALSLADLWKGEGTGGAVDPNAWLNITRHERNTSVEYGPEGGDPQSVWILSYSNFERLYYNLVAEYKAWGSVLHKMATWRHMSYVRLEGEDLALSLLPPDQRGEVRSWFTHGIGGIHNRLFFPLFSQEAMSVRGPGRLMGALRPRHLPPRGHAHPELVGANAQATVHEYVAELRRRFRAVAQAGLVHPEKVSAERKAWEEKLLALQHRSQQKTGETFAQFLPNTTYVRIQLKNGEHWLYTLLADRGYESHNLMLLENPVRERSLDSVSVYRGLVGAYPEAIIDLPEEQKDSLLTAIAGLTSDAQGEKLLQQYGVPRNREGFWQVFDSLHQEKEIPAPGMDPVEQGIFDLSQYLFFAGL